MVGLHPDLAAVAARSDASDPERLPQSRVTFPKYCNCCRRWSACVYYAFLCPAILMCIALVQIDILPFSVGLSLILGANLGSALIPLWLAKDMNATARRVPVANLILRGSGAVISLRPAHLLFAAFFSSHGQPADWLILFLISFNTFLVFISIPIVRPLDGLLEGFSPDLSITKPKAHHSGRPAPQS